MSDFVAVAMLAGGKSQRMGFDKQLLHVYKDRLFAHLLPTLNGRFEDVLVVTDRPEIYHGMGVRPIRDVIPGIGPLSGIHAALKETKSEYVYILACDMPKIDLDYMDYMAQKLMHSPADACVTGKGDRVEPFHAFYGKRALSTIEAHLLAGENSIYYLLQKIDTLYISEAEARRFTTDWSLFCNLNTPEDYLMATSLPNSDF